MRPSKHSSQSLPASPRLLAAACSIALLNCAFARAEDWPTYQHDNRRSGATSESLNVAALAKAWVHRSPTPPEPAWAGPAKWDAFAGIRGMRSMRSYDPAYMVVVVGNRLYFGSSADDSVHCLDAETGKEIWTHTTDGPVRVAPTWFGGRVHFGSDDGFAYCLDAETGRLVWRHRPAPAEALIPSNGRLISPYPVRTGVLVSGDRAIFAASLLPWRESFLCAVDAKTGDSAAPGSYRVSRMKATMEGPLVASPTRLYVPQGRIPPSIHDLETGKHIGDLKGGGGVYCLLTPDNQFVHGPGNKTGWLSQTSLDKRDKVAQIKDGRFMVVRGERSYLIKGETLSAIDRSTGRAVWETACGRSCAMILAGETLFVGRVDEVVAYGISDGKRAWRRPADGKVFGLAVANGGLFASTNTGAIHCFREETP